MSVVSAHHTQNLLVIHGLSFWTYVPKTPHCVRPRFVFGWCDAGSLAVLPLRCGYNMTRWDAAAGTVSLSTHQTKNQHGSPTHPCEIDPKSCTKLIYLWKNTESELREIWMSFSIFYPFSKTHGRWCDLMPRNSGVEHSSKSLGHSSQYCQGGSVVLPSPVWSCAIAGSSKLQQN